MTCTVATHEAIKLDDAAWFALPLRGIQRGCGLDLELRDCPACRSTLAREIGEESAEDKARGEWEMHCDREYDRMVDDKITDRQPAPSAKEIQR